MAANEEGIQLAPMKQLSEAIKPDDDWTGLADSTARRKKQNRLNQRAYRRRKALEAEWKARSKPPEDHDWRVPLDHNFQHPISWESLPQPQLTDVSPQPHWESIPQSFRSSTSPQIQLPGDTPAHWNTIPPPSHSISPERTDSASSPENTLSLTTQPLIPYINPTNAYQSPSVIIFPLPADHLITLVQYNVLRATLTNMTILSLLHCLPAECGGALGMPILPTPTHIPPTLTPTALQLSTPHDLAIDIVPMAQMRDNMILFTGQYDHDDLCNDLVGGLYEGFNDVEMRGMVVWSDPWHPNGWEVTEGFARKWAFLLRGCGELIESTNRWRAMRNEERLIVEV